MSEILNEQEKIINELLVNEKNHVIHSLLIINIDNFRTINEAYGFDKGDEVIAIIDEKVKNFFKGTDIIAKIKWDEVAVLIQNPKNITNIEKISENILEIISNTKIGDISMTASIGVAVYPFHGKNYEQLKTNAYQALIRAKANGKNGYRLFEAALTKAMFSSFIFGGDYESFDYRKINESEWDKYFLDVSLQLIHYDSNIFASLNSILEIFCLYHGYSRAFIITDREHSTYDNKRMEFALPGYEVSDTNLVRMLRSDLISRLHEEFNEYALINSDTVVSDVEITNYLSITNTKELLFFAVKKAGNFSGAVVFENADDVSVNIDENQVLGLYNQMSSVINYALLSRNYRGSKELISKIEMFEGMGSNVYIIDANTHLIEYMNRNAISSIGNNCVGMKCYELMQNRSKVCEDCPIAKMDINDSKANERNESFNHASCKWNVNLYSWLSGRDNKGKALLISIDLDGVFGLLDKQGN